MTSFARMKISRQLLILTMAITVLVFASLIVVLGKFSRDAALHQAEDSLRQQLAMLSSFLDYTYQTQVSTAKRRLNAFQKLLPGKLTVGAATMKTGDSEEVPVVRAGSEVMNNNLHYLEALKQINTGEGFILARKNDQYIRVATLLKDAQGRSQVGQALKANEPQVAALNRGQGYIGIIHRNGKSFMSIYEPIVDEAGKVVGAWGLRSSLEADLAALREIVKKQKVGSSGYFFAFSEAGSEVGRLTIHPSKEGSSFRDLFGSQPDILRLFEEVVRDKGGTKVYPWPNAAHADAVEAKMTVFGYSPEWGWYFGAGTFVDELTADADRLRHLLLLATLLAAVLIGGAIHLAIRRRLQPLAPVVAGLTALGHGNLSLAPAPAPAESDNELDQLAAELNATATSIRTLVGSISVTSEQLSAAAMQLDKSSDEVALSAQEQSDSAATMAASIEQFSVSVSQVADLAREAAEITRREHAAADVGERMVGEVRQEMETLAGAVRDSGLLVESLGKRSVDIEGIVGLIKEVAEQTNLLALNAAIEAARAGEAGRGFAVVADEVRKLAERTTSATADISQMIHGVRSETEQVVDKMRVVVSDVSAGVAKVERAGQALQDIREQSEHSLEVVNDIAAATHEQSLAGHEVARKLESVAQMAEETSSVTAQNRQAAADLGKLSRHLHEQVRRFRL